MAADAITDIDLTAADALADLHAALTQGGVVQHLAGLKGPARNRLAR